VPLPEDSGGACIRQRNVGSVPLVATETETKYEADATAALPDLNSLPQVRSTRGPDLEQLEAEYYDTADLRLLRSGITLRRRKGGHDAGWHLKLPDGRDSREEIRVPLGQAGRRVPAELANLVKAFSRNERLAPVAAITTLRQTITLVDNDGESLAEVADDQVHATAAAGGNNGSAEWREVEVELTGGDRNLLDAADKLLRRAGMRRSGGSAKLERVLASRLPTRPEPSADQTAADVVAAYLREHADRLVTLDPMVRRARPDAVHKMRVATRRLRSTLRSFDTVASTADSEHVAEELKWLGTVLGEERDAEVQARRLREHVRATEVEVLLGPVEARIQADVAKAAATSHSAVMTALTSARYYGLLDALDALIASPKAGPRADRPASEELPRAVGRSFRKTQRRMRAVTSEPPGAARDAALHAARKAAKRTRYAAEAAVPVGGKQAQQFASQMEKVQSVLGEHHDTVVGREHSRRLGIAAHLADESAFTYGLFYERDACSAERLDAQARSIWRRARHRKYRSWLAGR
jgi:CHAD domain-containing protein